MSRGTSRQLRRHVAIYAGLAPFVVIAVFPVVWMAITAFKEEADLYRMDQVPFWFHLPPTLKNFEFLFMKTHFGSQVANSPLLAVCVVSMCASSTISSEGSPAHRRTPSPAPGVAGHAAMADRA
jgi:ABC-type glycerol-3-phosphate transport system permease component